MCYDVRDTDIVVFLIISFTQVHFVRGVETDE